MIYFLFIWNFLIILCYPIGLFLLNVLKADKFKKVGDRFIAAVWLGVVVLLVALLTTALILPLSPLVGSIVAIAFVSGSLLSPRTRAEVFAFRSLISPYLLSIFFTTELVVAALMTQQVTWIDTGLYHYGAIKWLSQFGAVPGLALLNSQLGFISSWFAFAAPLNPEFLEGRACAVTNGFAFLLAVLQLLMCLKRAIDSRSQLSDWFIIISSLTILPFLRITTLMSAILISPSPDIPVILLTLVVSWSILICSQQEEGSQSRDRDSILNASAIPLLLSLGAVTMKLNALPLSGIASIYYLLYKKINWQRFFTGIVIIIGMLLPIFIFGFIASGCPLYPSSFLCLPLRWSSTPQEANKMFEITRGWGVWYGSPPPSEIPVIWLFWQWFKSMSSSKLIILSIAISSLTFIYVVRTVKLTRNFGQLWLLALAILGTGFTILQAPLLRFGLGYIALLPTLTVAIFCCLNWERLVFTNHPTETQSLNSAKDKFKIIQFTTNLLRIVRLKAVRLVLLSLGCLVLVVFLNREIKGKLVFPPELPQVDLLTRQVNDVVYFFPNNKKGACWAAELPCTFQRKNLKLRDPKRGIKGGFVRAQ